VDGAFPEWRSGGGFCFSGYIRCYGGVWVVRQLRKDTATIEWWLGLVARLECTEALSRASESALRAASTGSHVVPRVGPNRNKCVLGF